MSAPPSRRRAAHTTDLLHLTVWSLYTYLADHAYHQTIPFINYIDITNAVIAARQAAAAQRDPHAPSAASPAAIVSGDSDDTFAESHDGIVSRPAGDTDDSTIELHDTIVKGDTDDTSTESHDTIVSSDTDDTSAESHDAIVNGDTDDSAVESHDTIVNGDTDDTSTESHDTIVNGDTDDTSTESHDAIVNPAPRVIVIASPVGPIHLPADYAFDFSANRPEYFLSRTAPLRPGLHPHLYQLRLTFSAQTLLPTALAVAHQRQRPDLAAHLTLGALGRWLTRLGVPRYRTMRARAFLLTFPRLAAIVAAYPAALQPALGVPPEPFAQLLLAYPPPPPSP